MSFYVSQSGTGYYITIATSVFFFSNHDDMTKFWKEIIVAPAGTVKYTYKINYDWFNQPLDLNYNLLSYEFFGNCRLGRGEPAKVVSENVLNDGRVSVIYTTLRYENWGRNPKQFYLAVGNLIFRHWRIEPLKRLEHAINEGYASWWRRELSGTMDYIPKYSVCDYDERRHAKYTTEELYVSSYAMPGDTVGHVYKRVAATCRYYLRFHCKLYSLTSLKDCELIINQIKARNSLAMPPANEEANRTLLESIEVIGARIGPYLTADMCTWYHRSDLLSISRSGYLTGLNFGTL
jgi:hypothetical protein